MAACIPSSWVRGGPAPERLNAARDPNTSSSKTCKATDKFSFCSGTVSPSAAPFTEHVLFWYLLLALWCRLGGMCRTPALEALGVHRGTVRVLSVGPELPSVGLGSRELPATLGKDLVREARPAWDVALRLPPSASLARGAEALPRRCPRPLLGLSPCGAHRVDGSPRCSVSWGGGRWCESWGVLEARLRRQADPDKQRREQRLAGDLGAAGVRRELRGAGKDASVPL